MPTIQVLLNINEMGGIYYIISQSFFTYLHTCTSTTVEYNSEYTVFFYAVLCSR